jgi:hypothetical protein
MEQLRDVLRAIARASLSIQYWYPSKLSTDEFSTLHSDFNLHALPNQPFAVLHNLQAYFTVVGVVAHA